MFKLNNIWFCAIIAAMMMVACTKENLDEKNIVKEEVVPEETVLTNSLLNRSNGDEETAGLDLDCIVIEYPFSVVDAEGEEYLLNSDEDFFELLEDSTSGVQIIDFVYPLTVTVDGESESIEDGEELAEIFSECVPDGGWTEDYFPAYLVDEDNSCFSLVYPVNLVNESGETVVANNEEEFVEKITEAIHFFSFPITLINEDEEEIPVNDVDEMFNVLFSCNEYYDGDSTDFDWEDGFEFIGCFEIEFPFNVELPDGSIVSVEDHEAYCDLLLQGEVSGFAYPLTLLDDEGNEVIINSEEELEEVLEDCDDINSNVGDFVILIAGAFPVDSTANPPTPCYSISFPIDVVYSDWSGESFNHTFASIEEVVEFDFIVTELIYPVTIVLSESEEEVELNSIQDILEVIQDCY